MRTLEQFDAQLRGPLKEAAAASDGTAELGALLRRAWSRRMSELFDAGIPGFEISIHLSQSMDRLIDALADAIGIKKLAIVATGGYGRGRLAPYSDIDLLLLLPRGAKQDRTSRFLYCMWDAGLAISQSVHTPKSAVKGAKEDMVTCTAFLDARPLCGNMALAEEFLQGYDLLRQKMQARFVETKIKERDDRHEQNDLSRYAIEPDVKEGKGGLRDLDTLHWLDRFVSGGTNVATGQIETLGLFTEREERRLRRVHDFLWSVRVHLHRHMGRADETLNFAAQPVVAEKLGVRSTASGQAVERFMRRYFLTTREVGRLTGAALAELEARAIKRPLRGRLASKGTLHYKDQYANGIVLIGDRIGFSEKVRTVSPTLALALFREVGRSDRFLHPDAFMKITRAARQMTFRDLTSGSGPALFREILSDSNPLEPVLRAMSETGVLSRLVPSFGAVAGKVEYGLFRRYTIDEHILRSIATLDQLLTSEDDAFLADFPYHRDVGQLRMPLALALLQQEYVCASPEDEEELIEQTKVLAGDDEQAGAVAFVVKERALLPQAVSRRYIFAPSVTDRLGKTVKSVERLKLLALFTACRQRTAGVGSWDEYRKRDEKLLVRLIETRITDGEEGVAELLLRRGKVFVERVAALLDPDEVERFRTFYDTVDASFWLFTDVPLAADLTSLAIKSDDEGIDGLADVQVGPDGTMTVLVYTADRPGLFAQMAGAVAEIGGSVFASTIFTAPDTGTGKRPAGMLFHARRVGSPLQPFDLSAEQLESVKARMTLVAQDKADKPRVPPPPINDRRNVFDVTPKVEMNMSESDDALIIEVEARDRPGLLYLLADSLAEIGVTVDLAMVATYGHRAVDTFYVQDAPGYKITDPRRIEAIRRQLLRVLNDDDSQA